MRLDKPAPLADLVDAESHARVAASWASGNFVGGGAAALLLIAVIRGLDIHLHGFRTAYLLWLGVAFIIFGLLIRPVFFLSHRTGMTLAGLATASVVGLFTAGVGPDLGGSVAQAAILVATTVPILFPWPYAVLILLGDLAATTWAISSQSGFSVPADRILILGVQMALYSSVTFWFASTLHRLFESEHRSRAETERALAELEQVDERRRTFLHQMSHQLRTPLNAIIGFSELLRSGVAGPLTDKQQEYVGDIASSGAHLLALVDDVLDIGKIDEGLLELRVKAFPASRVAMASAALCRGQAERKRIRLEVQIREEGQLVADERKVRQILLNLLSNSIKATPRGGLVEVVVARTGPWFDYTVSDTGPGIPEEDRERIFMAFEQVGGQAGGTGLGLAVARNLAQAHGGSLNYLGARSGASFVLRLPASATETPLLPDRAAVAGPIRRRSILDENSWLEVLAGKEGLARYRAVWTAILALSEVAMGTVLEFSGALPKLAVYPWLGFLLAGLTLGLWPASHGGRLSAGQFYAFGVVAGPLVGAAAWISGPNFTASAGAVLLTVGLGAFAWFHLKKAVLLGVEIAVVYGIAVTVQPRPAVALFEWVLTMGLMAAGAILSRWLLGFLPAHIQSENQGRRQLLLLRAQLEEAGRHRAEFLASMSHELRTPLNAIIGFAEGLDQGVFGVLNPKAAEYVADIAGSGRQLLTLINDILELAKATAGKLTLTVRPTTLDEVLDAACTGALRRAVSKGVKFRVVSDGAADLVADPHRLTQAVRCVVSNAVDFTGAGGSVLVWGRVEAGGCRIEVSDDGPGIEESDHERIFAPFEFAGDQRVRLGSGIGLALARQLVELHGGSLVVDSAVGEGSRFVFEIPAAARAKVPT